MHLEQVRQDAEANPAELLGRLLQTFDRAMTAGEIKDCLSGIVIPINGRDGGQPRKRIRKW